MTFKPSLKYLSIVPIIFAILGVAVSFYFLCFAVLIFAFLLIKIKYTSIILHDDRIELVEGILMKSRQEVYFNKINNMDFLQNPVQSYLNVGSVNLFTGNDRAVTLDSVEDVSTLVSTINQKRNK